MVGITGNISMLHVCIITDDVIAFLEIGLGREMNSRTGENMCVHARAGISRNFNTRNFHMDVEQLIHSLKTHLSEEFGSLCSVI